MQDWFMQEFGSDAKLEYTQKRRLLPNAQHQSVEELRASVKQSLIEEN